jgi:hypothetical protein
MASQTPFAKLVGVWKFWIAPQGEALPALDATPAGNWAELGNTTGEQTIQLTGTLTAIRDNHSTGPRKHIRPEEGFGVSAQLADLTLEGRAGVRGIPASEVVTATSGGLTVKKLANRRGFISTRYALLARGGAIEATNTMSPYGAWPAQLYIPVGVFDGEPSETYSVDGSPSLEFTFAAEFDATQTAGNEFGWMEAQSA